MYVSLSAFQNSDPCRRESDLVLLVFVLRRAGKGEKGRGRREGGEGKQRKKKKEGRRRKEKEGEGRRRKEKEGEGRRRKEKEGEGRRREEKEGEGRRRKEKEGEGRGAGIVTTHSRDSCPMKRLWASVSHLETSVKGNGTRFLP